MHFLGWAACCRYLRAFSERYVLIVSVCVFWSKVLGPRNWSVWRPSLDIIPKCECLTIGMIWHHVSVWVSVTVMKYRLNSFGYATLIADLIMSTNHWKLKVLHRTGNKSPFNSLLRQSIPWSHMKKMNHGLQRSRAKWSSQIQAVNLVSQMCLIKQITVDL